jgi:ribonuclease-3
VSEVARFAEQRLGHRPRNEALFQRALTHSSASRDSYERLEFLGDRVLGLTIARWLYEARSGFPH